MSATKILGVEYHRNGIGGAGFYVVTFLPGEDPNAPMVGIVFCDDLDGPNGQPRKHATEKVAVLRCSDVAEAGTAQDGGILSMDAGAAWRGSDTWGPAIIAAIRDRNTNGTLYGYESNGMAPLRSFAVKRALISAGKPLPKD